MVYLARSHPPPPLTSQSDAVALRQSTLGRCDDETQLFEPIAAEDLRPSMSILARLHDVADEARPRADILPNTAPSLGADALSATRRQAKTSQRPTVGNGLPIGIFMAAAGGVGLAGCLVGHLTGLAATPQGLTLMYLMGAVVACAGCTMTYRTFYAPLALGFARPCDRPLLVGIAGGTGSGKTTLAQKIAQNLPHGSVVVLDYDAYYHDRSSLPKHARQEVNYDHPSSVDNDLLLEHLDRLKAGIAFDKPFYDFATHSRLATRQTVTPVPLVILEGVLVFHDPRVRERLDIKIFVDTDADIRIIRRLGRDMRERGRTFSQVCEQYTKSVRLMHLQFVEPTRCWADIVISDNGYDSDRLDQATRKVAGALRARTALASLARHADDECAPRRKESAYVWHT